MTFNCQLTHRLKHDSGSWTVNFSLSRIKNIMLHSKTQSGTTHRDVTQREKASIYWTLLIVAM